MAAFLWFLASAIFVDLAGYWLHRWAHVRSSPLWRPHVTHHAVNYPPQAVMSTSYRSSRSDSLAIWFAPFGALYLLALMVLGCPHLIAAVLGGASVAVLSSVAHDLAHIHNSLVWRLNGYTKGVAVRHIAHHYKTARNFGILVPWWDSIFRTRGSRGTSPRSPQLRSRGPRRPPGGDR